MFLFMKRKLLLVAFSPKDLVHGKASKDVSLSVSCCP